MGEQVAAGINSKRLELLRNLSWGYSSVGRAPALQAGGQGFESLYLHGGISYHVRAYSSAG